MSDSSSASTWQNFLRLMTYTKPYRMGFVFAVIGMLGYAAVDTFVFAQLQPLIDIGLTGKSPDFMKWAPIFIVVMFILRGICHFVGNYCLAWVGNNVVADLRLQLFQHIINLPVSFHDQQSTGTLISKLTYDTEQVLTATSKALLTLVQQGAFVAGLLAVMFYNSWQLSLIFLVITPVIAVLVTVVSKRFRKVSQGIQNSMGEVTSAAEQTFNGQKVVLTFGGQGRETERFADINNNSRRQRMKMVTVQTLSVPVIQIIASFALAFVLYVANMDTMREQLTPGIFTTVLTCMVMLLRPLKLLTTVNSEFQRGMAASVSIFKVIDEHSEPDTGVKKIDRAKGNLSFENVDFAYQNEKGLALKSLSFEAKTGQTIAFVGSSGSGKSTATNLMLRFYQATGGKVLLDGHDINDYVLADVRKPVCLCFSAGCFIPRHYCQ